MLQNKVNELEKELTEERAWHQETRDKLDRVHEMLSRMACLGIIAARAMGDIDAFPTGEARCNVPATEPGGYGDGFEVAKERWRAFVKSKVLK